MAQRSLANRLWYECMFVICRLLGASLMRVRCEGRRNLPRTGGALLLANHQSLLDPVLVGIAADRRLNFLARDTLFRFAPFRWLIKSFDSIPIDREGVGLAGLKETLRRLRDGEIVVIFPEGTRTPDGKVQSLRPGFSALAKRARVPLVPVALDGAFAAWPRKQLLPGLGTIEIRFGPPLLPEDVAKLDERQLVADVEQRLRECFHSVRDQRLRRIGGERNVDVPESRGR